MLSAVWSRGAMRPAPIPQEPGNQGGRYRLPVFCALADGTRLVPDAESVESGEFGAGGRRRNRGMAFLPRAKQRERRRRLLAKREVATAPDGGDEPSRHVGVTLTELVAYCSRRAIIYTVGVLPHGNQYVCTIKISGRETNATASTRIAAINDAAYRAMINRPGFDVTGPGTR